ncbi:MAG: serine/threonine-protein kinase [Gemmataceae bacterium]
MAADPPRKDFEVTVTQAAPPPEPAAPARAGPRPLGTVAELVQVLKSGEFLTPVRFDKLTRDLQKRFTRPDELARELVRWGWITPYQSNTLLAGKASQLQLGPYLLQTPLASGGMGQVFRARHRIMERVVALKIIRPDIAHSSEAIGRFRREVAVVARMAHPNIVVAHDASEANGVYFLAMEFVDGKDLSTLVAQKGKLPIADACEYVRQAAVGLQHAHERGLVHRDIKPSNLMLTAVAEIKNAPPRPLVKILDLGLARLEQDTGDNRERVKTRLGAVMGTPDYMAPEQALDPRTADIRSDIYSLGCTLYFLLGGERPFPDPDLRKKMEGHIRGTPAPLASLRPEAPKALLAVVARMMAKKQAERYQTPAEAAQALAPFCAGAGVPDLAAATAAVSAAPLRSPLADAKTVVAAEAGAAGDSSLGESSASDTSLSLSLAPASEMGRSSGGKRVYLTLAALLVLLLGGGLVALQFMGGNGKEQNDPDKDKSGSLALPGPKTLDFGPPIVATFDPKYLDALDPAKIPPLERFDGQPKELVGVLGEHRLRGSVIAVSPDGSLIATATPGLVSGVFLGDPERLRQDRHLPILNLASIAISADNATLAVGQADGGARLWSIKEGKEIATLKPVARDEKELARLGAAARGVLARPQFSSGTRLLGLVEKEAWVWDTKTPEPIKVLKGHKGYLSCCAISPDGALALTGSGSDEGVVRLWNIDNERTLASVEPPKVPQETPKRAVHSVTFSKDGTRIAAGLGEEVHVWKTAEFGSEKTARVFKYGAQQSLAFSPDGKLLLLGDNVYLHLLDLETGKLVWQYHLYYAGQVAFYRAGGKRLLVSAGRDIRAFDEETKTEPVALRGPGGPVNAVAVSPDGRYVGAGGMHVRMAMFWDLHTGKEHECPTGNQVTGAFFSPDSRAFIYTGQDAFLPVLTDTASNEFLPLKLQKREGAAHTRWAAVSPDGRFLLGSFWDGVSWLWDFKSGETLRSFVSPPGDAGRVEFAPSGALALIHDELWDLKDAKKLHAFNAPSFFMPDGRVLSLGAKPAIFAVSASGVEERGATSLPPLGGGARPWPTLSANGKRLAAFIEKTLKVFDVPSGTVVWEYTPDPTRFEIRGVHLSPDGRYLFSGNNNGTVYIYRLP